MGHVPDILVIEDDNDLREVLLEILRIGGYEARGAANGLEALESLSRDPLPFVMLVDLVMPAMNGRKFIEHCNQDPRLRGIPRVVISAFADKLREIRARERLSRPLGLRNIVGLVEKLTAKNPEEFTLR